MKLSKSIAPPNSIVFIADGRDGVVPEIDDFEQPAWATPGCIIVKCFPVVDGPTQIVFGDMADVDTGLPASFTSALRTPRRVVQLTEVGDELIFEMAVATDITRVSIWLNHPRWPDKVIIGLG